MFYKKSPSKTLLGHTKLSVAGLMLSVLLSGCDIEFCLGAICTSIEANLSPEVQIVASQAQAQADKQGYKNGVIQLLEVPRVEIMRAISQGRSSTAAFMKFELTGASLVNSNGTVVAQIIDSSGVSSSQSFAYHRSADYLVLDQPQLLDQWLKSTQKVKGDSIQLIVPDITIDEGKGTHMVSMSANAIYSGTSYAGEQKSWQHRDEPTKCPKCQIQ
jgi:hypothetical protein